MFSPTNGSADGAPTTRASRRRPRPISNEHITAQPKAKRQRASIEPQTFVHPDDAVARRTRKQSAASALISKENKDSLAPKRELSVRSKKPKSDRYHKGDGSTVLTKNDTYTVSRLPALPDRLQAANAGRQHGSINADRGYALTLTKTHALVWPYAGNTTTPETFTFTLPHPSKHDSDPLPLGSLVSPSASSTEPGLVVVMPTSGKVTYWESISSAATLDLIQQQRHGVEHSIPGMYHTETVLQILNAESAGFILTFSSGRLAYMSVRDNQGRPAIATQYLRSANTQAVSIFDSFTKMLGSSSWKGDLAAARAGPSAGPGERSVVTAGTKGKLQAWNLHRGGHNHLEAEGDAKEMIINEIKRTDPSLWEVDNDTFELHDFTFAPPPAEQAQSEALTYREENGIELLALTSLKSQDLAHFALVQIFMRPDQIAVGAVRHITSYSTPVAKNSISKPRLYLPNPGVAAFIVFQRAIVITSMANEPDSPEAQLMADSHIGPNTFEDVIDFRRDTGVEITGSGLEEPHHTHARNEDPRQKRHSVKLPAVVLQVRGGGIIRVALVDPTKFTSSKPPQVTAKSKLEQAIFFGNLDNNILSFSGRSEIQFTAEEVGQAAIVITKEILTSKTPYLPSIPATIRENMAIRAAALDALIKHTHKMNVELSRSTKWELIWGAEKLAGASAAWNKYDTGLATKPQDVENSLWDLMVYYIHEDDKTVPNPEIGETDRVRHYFIHDVDKFHQVVAWAEKAIRVNQDSGKLTPSQMAHLICESNELIASTLQAAYDFRMKHAELYGVEDSVANDKGIVLDNLAGIPEPWTCQNSIVDSLHNQSLYCIKFLKAAEKREALADLPQITDIAEYLPKLVDLTCLTSEERVVWHDNQTSAEAKAHGAKFKTDNTAMTRDLLTQINALGLEKEAVDLAQRHLVLPVLAQLLLDKIWVTHQKIVKLQTEVGVTDQDLADAEEKYATFQAEIEGAEARREAVYEEVGPWFADAQYDYFIKRKRYYDLLLESMKHPDELTRYLRKHKEYAKLSWINEIKTNKNFDLAAQDLIEQGILRETDLWSKKVQLSIGKLTRLAAKSYSQVGGVIVPDGGALDLKEVERELEIINIQEKVFEHIRPATIGAIDADAELDEALKVFKNSQLDKKKALPNVLQEKMGWLLARNAMEALDLVDVLTLLGPRKIEAGHARPTSDITGEEFYYALKALNANGPEEKTQFILAEKTIWRRCLLRDDWKAVNSTSNKGDEEVSEVMRGTALYSTLRLGLKNGLFEKPSKLQPIKPDQLLAPASELDARYARLDEGIRAGLFADFQAEDKLLKTFIDKQRLQKWYEGTLSVAIKDVEREQKAERDQEMEVKRMGSRLEDMERRISRQQQDVAREMLAARRETPKLARRRGREGSRGVEGLLKQGSSLGSSLGVSFQSSLRP